MGAPSIQTRISKIRPFALLGAKVPFDKEEVSRTASSLLSLFLTFRQSAVADWVPTSNVP